MECPRCGAITVRIYADYEWCPKCENHIKSDFNDSSG